MRIRERVVKEVVLWIFFALFCACPFYLIGAPAVRDLIVTDVTTRSFCVVWASNEASYTDQPHIYVYDDPNGLVPTVNTSITPQPVESGNSAIAVLAENNGVLKVRVAGLSPGTTYYFRTVTTSKSTKETTLYPAAPPFPSIITETLTVRDRLSGEDAVPFSNDLIIGECFLDDGITPAEGTILIATVEGGDYPLSAFVGDGIAPPYAVIDLNNVFSRGSRKNVEVTEGKSITLLNFRGTLGNSVINNAVPLDEGLSAIKRPQSAIVPGWNMISFPLEPSDVNIAVVLAPLWDKFASIWEYNTQLNKWFRYDRFGPPFLNDLSELHAGKGYWLVMDEEASLRISGQFHDAAAPIYAGWNLVGYHSLESWGIPAVMDPIQSVLKCIWSYETVFDDWRRYSPSGPPFLNDLEWVAPGKAYWIETTGTGEW